MSVNPKSLKVETGLELQVYQGKDITWEMTVVNIEDGEAVNIAGAAIVFTVKENIEDSATLFSRSVGSGIIIDADQVNNKGKYQLSLIPSNTDNLDPGTYEFDIQLTLSGKEQTIARGTLEALPVVG